MEPNFCLDRLWAVFPKQPVFPKAAIDVAEGLEFLHSRNVVHCDLKPRNVLVSNKHYACPDVNRDQFEDLFGVEPVVCKLTDFGLSHCRLLQTSVIIHAQTSNVERRTKPYMAPEILLERRKITTATLEDTKAIDVWAFGMTLLSIINPDTTFPFEIELKSIFPTAANGPARFQSLLQEKMEGKLKPSSPRKYHRLQASLWINTEETFKRCTNYDASLRPSAQEVLQQLKASNAKGSTGKLISLKVSQSTPIKEADKQFAEPMEQGTSKAVK